MGCYEDERAMAMSRTDSNSLGDEVVELKRQIKVMEEQLEKAEAILKEIEDSGCHKDCHVTASNSGMCCYKVGVVRNMSSKYFKQYTPDKEAGDGTM